jgi:hypothetical protein
VTATPASVLAGSRVRLAVAGFNNGDTVAFPITGQPDFTVRVASGAYVWDAFCSTRLARAERYRFVPRRPVGTAQRDRQLQHRRHQRDTLSACRLEWRLRRTGAPGRLLPATAADHR